MPGPRPSADRLVLRGYGPLATLLAALLIVTLVVPSKDRSTADAASATDATQLADPGLAPADTPEAGAAPAEVVERFVLGSTAGPVEHVTDLLLADVIRRGSGPVRLVLQGESAGHLRVHVESGGRAAADHGDEPLDRVSQVRSVVESMGGRVKGQHPAEGIDVLLPRR